MLEFRDIAIREERRCALSIADVADAHIACGGGLASRGAAGTWVNTAVALGLSGPVNPQEILALCAWYEAVAAEPRVEVCPFVDASLTQALAATGFTLRSFENVFFRALHAGEQFRPPQALPADLQIRVVDGRERQAARAFALAVATGFADGQPAAVASIDLTARCLEHPRTFAIAAYWVDPKNGGAGDGVCVGGGCFELFEDQAALWGLSVLPEFRRRGIQQALLAARLKLAAERGARLATISGSPGMATESNARRFGFQLAYTKAILTRPGPNLQPVIG